MANLAGGDSAWAFTPPLGELRVGTLCARVDVSRPELGVNNVQVSGRALADGLLSVFRESDAGMKGESGWPLAIADAYVRGNDLVASYQPADEWPYSPQIYWRANSLAPTEGVVGSLSLLISVQTNLLDTWPRIGVCSRLACDEALYVQPRGEKKGCAEQLTRDLTIEPSTGACCIVRRLANLPFSYVEIMPASDFRKVDACRDDGGWRVDWAVFGEFLEKGVIRRTRLQSAFVRRKDDVQIAAACCNAMEQSSLPLTT
jgi:hypothetical protein